MGLLDTEILSNRWDVENSLNNAMNKTAMAWGQLDRTKYAPMTASTALQGDMYGRSIGSMLGGQHPELQKQDIIDDIMKRYPDPRTSTELRAVAKEFAEANLTNYAFQIIEVANELYKTETTKDTATESWYDDIGKMLGNQILTNDIVELYAKQMFNVSEEEWAGYKIVDRDRLTSKAKVELQGQITNYANRKKMQGLRKSEITKLTANDHDFFQDFYADLHQHGNTKVVEFLQRITNFESIDGKNTMQMNTDFFYKISDDDISKMGVDQVLLAITSLEEAMKSRPLTQTEKDNYARLKSAYDAINNPDQSQEAQQKLFNQLRADDRFKDLSDEKIWEMVRRELGITASASNIQYASADNFASWVVPSAIA